MISYLLYLWDCTSVMVVVPVTLEQRGVQRDSSSLLFWNDRGKITWTPFLDLPQQWYLHLLCYTDQSDLPLTSSRERRLACSSANARLGCRSFRAQKQRKRRHRRPSHACTGCVWAVWFWRRLCPVRISNAPVEDVWQVKLQQTFSQGHKRQQAGVEEEQKQQPAAHGEAVGHAAVLHKYSTHKILNI